MKIFLPILIMGASVLGMEGFSWFVHKYLFHGFLWFIHKTHHEAGHRRWEWNDLFSLFFGSVAILLMILGNEHYDPRFWIGAGISLYGIIYFILHDIFVHNRLKSFSSNNTYLLNLRRAHKMHHKSLEKSPSESFGLLIIPKKYLKKDQ